MAMNTQPYGIVLPIAHGPNGYFNQSYSVLEQIKTNLNILLKTKKGERRMNPEFGSGLWTILFENSSDNLYPIIESTIKEDITRWMRYVSVQSITVNTSDDNANRLDVKVSFIVPSAGVTTPQTINVQMGTNNV